jgi:hypothetical protein
LPEVLNRAQALAVDDDVKALLQGVELKQARAEGGAKGGRPKKGAENLGVNSTKVSGHGSTNIPYLVRRLKRDAPEIAAALGRGEYPSARAAAIAAGIVKVPTPLEVLRKAWAKASAEERALFLRDITETQDLAPEPLPIASRRPDGRLRACEASWGRRERPTPARCRWAGCPPG